MTPEKDFIDFDCPYCNGAVSFPEEFRGKLQECVFCGESLIVPAATGGPTQKIPIPITTHRLSIRRLAPTDWKDLLEFLSDEELFRYGEGRPMDEDQIVGWLESDRHIKLTTPKATFCLALESAGRVIGVQYLDFADELRVQTTLRVFVGRKVQRQGFAAEAVRAVLGFCFERIGMHRIMASCDARNVAAQRLFAKVGMRREAQFRKDRWVEGEWVDTMYHAILEEDYFSAGKEPPRRDAS